jgi:hypothetical protein
MGCTKSFMGLEFGRHDWHRRVSHADERILREYDQWGRPYFDRHVICHTEYVCHECGAVRDDGECTCEHARGDRCPIRLAWLGQPAAQ